MLNQVKEKMLITNEKIDNLRRQVETLDMIFFKRDRKKGEIVTNLQKVIRKPVCAMMVHQASDCHLLRMS